MLLDLPCSSSPTHFSHVQSQQWRVPPGPPLLPCRSTRRRPSSSSPPAGLSPRRPPPPVRCPPPLRQESGAVRVGLGGPTGRMRARAVRASPGTAPLIHNSFRHPTIEFTLKACKHVLLFIIKLTFYFSSTFLQSLLPCRLFCVLMHTLKPE